MSKKHRDPNAVYQVFEEINGELVDEIVAEPQKGRGPIRYNVKPRLYRDLDTARAYKNRLKKEGRTARVFKYVRSGEVT